MNHLQIMNHPQTSGNYATDYIPYVYACTSAIWSRTVNGTLEDTALVIEAKGPAYAAILEPTEFYFRFHLINAQPEDNALSANFRWDQKNGQSAGKKYKPCGSIGLNALIGEPGQAASTDWFAQDINPDKSPVSGETCFRIKTTMEFGGDPNLLFRAGLRFPVFINNGKPVRTKVAGFLSNAVARHVKTKGGSIQHSVQYSRIRELYKRPILPIAPDYEMRVGVDRPDGIDSNCGGFRDWHLMGAYDMHPLGDLVGVDNSKGTNFFDKPTRNKLEKHSYLLPFTGNAIRRAFCIGNRVHIKDGTICDLPGSSKDGQEPEIKQTCFAAGYFVD